MKTIKHLVVSDSALDPVQHQVLSSVTGREGTCTDGPFPTWTLVFICFNAVFLQALKYERRRRGDQKKEFAF